jgi:hypothetical protein
MMAQLQEMFCPVARCIVPIVIEAGSLPRERLVAFIEHAQVVHHLPTADAWAFGALAEPAGAQQVYEEAEKNG